MINTLWKGFLRISWMSQVTFCMKNHWIDQVINSFNLLLRINLWWINIHCTMKVISMPHYMTNSFQVHIIYHNIKHPIINKSQMIWTHIFINKTTYHKDQSAKTQWFKKQAQESLSDKLLLKRFRLEQLLLKWIILIAGKPKEQPITQCKIHSTQVVKIRRMIEDCSWVGHPRLISSRELLVSWILDQISYNNICTRIVVQIKTWYLQVLIQKDHNLNNNFPLIKTNLPLKTLWWELIKLI